MKLLSISLTIAATLAAIAGGPLHARALEQVNSFEERDADIYRRGTWEFPHHKDHKETADLFKSAIEACRNAADHLNDMFQRATSPTRREQYSRDSQYYATMATHFEVLEAAHRGATRTPKKDTKLHAKVDEHKTLAQEFESTCVRAITGGHQ